MNNKTKNFLESAVIAKYFGFKIIEPENVTKEDIKSGKNCQEVKDYLDENLFPIEEAIAHLRRYKEEAGKDPIDPGFYYFEGSSTGSHKKHRKSNNEEFVNLHSINIEKGSGDALIIKTTEAILNENGIKNICLKINDIGGKESKTAFQKEATAYYRKNISELSAHCRQLFKEGIHALFNRGKNECTQIHEEAPKPMDFLGEDSRKNFSEILENIETLDIPYEIDPFQIGDPNYSTHTVFQFIDQDTDKVVAAGSRYNLLSKKAGLKAEFPAIGVTIKISKPKKITEKNLNKLNESKFFFLQIGAAAKLKALSIIDDLRKENIPVKHTLHKEKLSNQIAAARRSKASYFIIFGQKEALEDEVIVRDRESKFQKIISRKELPKHLKGLK